MKVKSFDKHGVRFDNGFELYVGGKSVSIEGFMEEADVTAYTVALYEEGTLYFKGVHAVLSWKLR